MTKTKKFSLMIFGFMFVIANFFFVGCGAPNYSKTTLICSENETEITSLDMRTGEERIIDVTITSPASGMSNELYYEVTPNPYAITVEEVSIEGYTTKYKITGQKGGQTSLNLTSKDGQKSVSLEINVRQNASELKSNGKNLFVSNLSALTISSDDFEFGEGTTEKTLKYYFYGQKANSLPLDEDDVTNYGVKSNEFVKVEQRNIEKNGETKSYLVFTNSNNELFSISASPQINVTTGNSFYNFIKITNFESQSSSFKEVVSGDEFYFVAVYQNGEDLSCERKFTVLKDIEVLSNIEYAYRTYIQNGEEEDDIDYRNLQYSQISVNEDFSFNDALTLVPKYTTINSNRITDYKVAYLKVTTKTNLMQKVSPSSEDEKYLSGKVFGPFEDSQTGLSAYYIQISSSSGTNANTSYSVNFYYDGYENLPDERVNFKLKVPVKVQVIPEKLFVNDKEATDTYTFYNRHQDEMYGWQEFRFSLNPSDASYEKIEIDLNGSGLKIRYKNVEYFDGGNQRDNFINNILTINDIDEVLFIKGVEGTQEVLNKQLNIKLYFKVFGEDFKEAVINYQILNGADKIYFANEEFENSGLYVDINENQDIDLSNILYTQASFSSVYFNLISGENVAVFKVDNDNIFIKRDDKYFINFSLLDRNFIGDGTYLVRLDNGVSTTLKIVTIEGLQSVQISSTNSEKNLVGSENGNNENLTLYVLNNLKENDDFLDIQILANNKSSSNAIESFNILKENAGNDITIFGENQRTKTFNIVLSGANISENITIDVKGYKVENFQRVESEIVYKVHVVSFSYVEKLNVLKTKEGGSEFENDTPASTTTVYFNTSDEQLRKAYFKISVNSENAYLFRTKNTDGEFVFVEENFDEKFVAWEYNGEMYYPVDGNIIEVPEIGYFNMQELSFTALENIDNRPITFIAKVVQYGKTYSFQININFEEYIKVSGVSLSKATNEINLSSLKREDSVIAFSNNKTATNPKLTAYLKNNHIVVNGTNYDMFEIASKIESDGKYLFVVKPNEDFRAIAYNLGDQVLQAKLYIVAEDWLASEDVIKDDYTSSAIILNVNFENGTELNRYSLTTEEDFKNFDFNAHYKLSTVVDVSSILNLLPLDEFNGSIVGLNDYAEIKGINLTSKNLVTNDSNELITGLFKSIGRNGYIDNVTFSGSIKDIVTTGNAKVKVGLVASENKGNLRNIAVNIDESNLEVFSGLIGGVVGENKGTISQDYSFTQLWSGKNYQPLQSYKTVVTTLGNFVVTGYDIKEGITYKGGEVSFGGVAGRNSGIIEKIDALEKTNFIGYTNYFSYVNLEANKKREMNGSTEIYSNTIYKTGAVVGENNGTIYGGMVEKLVTTEGTVINKQIYKNYVQTPVFVAGKGLIAGGQITSTGYLGGIAGQSASAGSNFSGLTSRVFLRGSDDVAGFANVQEFEQNYNAYALQAVENGKFGQDASMIIIDKSSLTESGFNNLSLNANILAFGNNTKAKFFDGATNLENTTPKELREKAFKTFVNRTYQTTAENDDEFTSGGLINETEVNLSGGNKSSYFGDIIILGKSTQGITKIKQCKFKLDMAEISVDANIFDSEKTLSNRMGEKDDNAFYMYYFEVDKVAEGSDKANIQNYFDQNLNKLTSSSSLYPFVASGELILESQTPEVLTIDQNGKISVKRTGLARILVSSILNQTNEMYVYIYSVNYFNSTLNESIVYPTQSNQSTKVDKTEINIFANSSTSLYIIGDYSFDFENVSLDKNGDGLVQNVQTSIKSNDEISANVSPDEKDKLEVKIVGNEIRIAKNNNTEENKTYKITITPVISFSDGEKIFTTVVNKTLTEVSAVYTKGAIEIRNKVYDEVSINSSSKIEETIILTSTSQSEKVKIEIFDEKGNSYDELFDVKIAPENSSSSTPVNGVYTYIFNLKISVKTNSELFKNRAENDVYKTYRFVINAMTNVSVKMVLPVTLEKIDVKGVTLTNYSKENNQTDIAVPGEKGHMAISLSPIDGEYDYILIENADENYLSGRASAVFGLSTLNNLNGTDEIYNDDSIIGSVTSKGIKLTRQQIEEAYGNNFNGEIYINYLMGAKNVENKSTSYIVVKVCKNGQDPLTATKPLTIKLSSYAKILIDGKEEENENSYAVARGLEYKLDFDLYGYSKDEIILTSSNTNLGQIEKRGNDCYLVVTKNRISYTSEGNYKFIVSAKISENNSDIILNEINVTIREFVVNYNGLKDKDKDIIPGMGDGVVDIQIGSSLALSLDLYDYIEFDYNDLEIQTKVDAFVESLANSGYWQVYTNLNESLSSPELGKTAETGKSITLDDSSLNTYYFKYSNRRIIPTKTYEPTENGYYITYVGKFDVSSGGYKAENVENSYKNVDDDKNIIKTKFSLNVFTSSSDSSPIPIFEYRDLLKMNEGGYYILLNNIIVPNEETTLESGEIIPAFTPITTKIASLDGNGLSIIFNKGKYDMGDATKIALFESLDSGCVIKNLTVSYQSTDTSANYPTNGIGESYDFTPPLTSFVTTATEFTFGGIVADNSGSITNCKVETKDNSYMTIVASGATEESFIGLIAGTNQGYITNSIVSVQTQAPFNIGGITGTNDGIISGCAFKEGVISNILSKSSAVAGIAIRNNDNGKILTSFVSGKQSNQQVLSSKVGSYGVDEISMIASPYSASGFVYQNRGDISDCYTDINLKGIRSTSGIGYRVAGFVSENGGQIRNCFSISLLQSNRDTSSGFAETSTLNEKQGAFANCYYLSDSDEKINVDLKQQSFDGVEALKLDEFKEESGKFSEYAHKANMGYNSVWFYPNGNSSSDYVTYQVTGNDSISSETGIEGKVVLVGNVEKQNMIFAKGRLELVNPNIISLSRRIFDTSVIDEESGEITYYYIDKDDAPVKGSLHNPRIVYNAVSMEEEFLMPTSKSNINSSNYRIVSDIDYSDYEGLSNLYTITFAGVLEGNGMTISGIGLETNKSLSNAGLFAQVGYSQAKRGSIKNLNVEFERVNFSEVTSVGGIAGTLKYGELHGIKVESYSSKNVTVLGQNFVGGIVGKAVENYEITDVYSELNISSSFISGKETPYIEMRGDENTYSYAGAIAGYLGTGSVYNVRSGGVNSVVGGKTGFVFGGVGQNANVNFVYLKLNDTSKIKSNLYAGLVAGEVEGSLSHIYVEDNGSDNDLFDVTSRLPLAVGGVTGLLSGGTISNAVINQTLNVNSMNSNKLYIESVGGLVGRVKTSGTRTSNIIESITTADVFSRQLSAGAVAEVQSPLNIDKLAVRATKINVAGQTRMPIAGGIVGRNSSILEIKNSYCLADIEIKSSTSGVDANAYAGGILALNTGSVKMSYCYTTSTITAQVYDARSVESLKDYAEYLNDDSNNNKIKFARNVVNDNIDNVYYFGYSENGYEYQKGFISFMSKTKDAKIELNVNCYGQSSYGLTETIRSDDSKLTKDVLENLFINRYVYNDPTNDTTYYKKSDLIVKIQVEDSQGNVQDKNEIRSGFQSGKVKLGDKSTYITYVYDSDDETKLIKLDGDGYFALDEEKNLIEIKEENFKQSKNENTWNYDTWGELPSLEFEKQENLVWLNKSTLGKV